VPSPPAQPAPSEERIGVVTHYYSHLSVATLRLESGTLRVGDVIHIRSHRTGTCGSPTSGSRTRLHAFTHGTSCPSRHRRTSPKCP
jgi:hypothetical protein